MDSRENKDGCCRFYLLLLPSFLSSGINLIAFLLALVLDSGTRAKILRTIFPAERSVNDYCSSYLEDAVLSDTACS